MITHSYFLDITLDQYGEARPIAVHFERDWSACAETMQIEIPQSAEEVNDFWHDMLDVSNCEEHGMVHQAIWDAGGFS